MPLKRLAAFAFLAMPVLVSPARALDMPCLQLGESIARMSGSAGAGGSFVAIQNAERLVTWRASCAGSPPSGDGVVELLCQGTAVNAAGAESGVFYWQKRAAEGTVTGYQLCGAFPSGAAGASAADDIGALYGALSESERIMVQTILRDQGYYQGAIDGKFGPMTRGAIEAMTDKMVEVGLVAGNSRREQVESLFFNMLQTDIFLGEG